MNGVLLISADKELRRQVHTCLADIGLTHNILTSMKNGLEWLTAVQRVRPRLIILDDSLPDLEGPGVLRALRHRAPEALVVYLATHHTLELERAVRQSGALYYTEKPPDLSLLAKVFAAVFASELEAR